MEKVQTTLKSQKFAYSLIVLGIVLGIAAAIVSVHQAATEPKPPPGAI